MNKSKHYQIKVKPVVIVFSILILPVILILILETVLYNSTFAYHNQPQNDYSQYDSFPYIVKNKKVDIVYLNRGGKDVFVYFHGNIGRLNYILDYLNQHTSFIAPAYPGYHGSEGNPSVVDSLILIAEILPVIEKIFGQDIRIHVIGHSLGSQTASYFAQQMQYDDRLQTLSLIAGFPSIRNQCDATLGFFSFLCFIADKSFNAENSLQHIGPIKVFVYHHPEDHVIPYRDGKKLYQEIPLSEKEGDGRKFFINFTSGTHGNFDIEMVVTNALNF